MKKYKLRLLTEKGIVEKIISESDDLAKVTEQIRKEHGDFITISSTEIQLF